MADIDLNAHDEGISGPVFVELTPGPRIDGVIRPPGSKSLTNRALICAALASGRSVLHGALCSEDTDVMIDALRKIGVTIDRSQSGRTLDIDGATRDRLSSESDTIDLFIANSGTSIRFLTAALSAAGGNYRIHGVRRMHQRPIGDLVDAIDSVLQGTLATESPEGCPPVHIVSDGWKGAELEVAGSVSSQFLSGLMMAAPLNRSCDPSATMRISVKGELVSRPYVDMTASVMRSFGANVHAVTVRSTPEDLAGECATQYEVSSNGYRGTEYRIEPDASAASYFWAAAAISGGSIRVDGLSREAMQGDVGFCDVLKTMGCEVENHADAITVTGHPLRGVDVNMNAISDTVQTLAVVSLFAEGPTRVRGVAHNRFKETDRIGDLACELRKLGARVQEHEDGMTIHPPTDGVRGATLETYHDHRMAMSLSLAGLRVPGVRILNPSCTSKTYPEFFADMEQLTGREHRWA